MKRVYKHEKYWLYEISGRPILAVPAGSRLLRQAAILRLQPSTRKRALYRGTLGLFMALNLDRYFCRPVESPLETMDDALFDWDDWLQEMRRYFCIPCLTATVFWPTNIERGRLYVHLLEENGCPVAFVKMSISSPSNGNAPLRREANILCDIEMKGLRTFRAPRLLTQGTIGNHLYLILEPLPVSARPIVRKPYEYPLEAVNEYSGPLRSISSDMVPKLSWWGQYLNKLNDHHRAFHDEMTKYLQEAEITVCRAHGDLSSHNVVRDGETLWIYDWEESVSDAPALTDSLGFTIALYQSAVRKNPITWTKVLKKRYFENVDIALRTEFMMALAFRHSVGINDATLIIQNWSRL